MSRRSRTDAERQRAHHGGRAGWMVLAVAGVLAAAAVGVVAFALAQDDRPDSPNEAVPTVEPSHSELADEVPADGVVATGVFESPDGSTSGQVEVRLRDGAAMVVFIDVESTHTEVGVEASLVSRENDPCTDGRGLSWGQADSASLTVRELAEDLVGADWTDYDEINLTVHTDAGSGSVNTIIARAPLTWSLGDARPRND